MWLYSHIMDEDLYLAVHEGSHAVVSKVLGRTAGPVAIDRELNGGRCFWVPPLLDRSIILGFDHSLPMILWPQEVQSRFIGDVLTLMAGQAGTDQLYRALAETPPLVRASDRISEQVIHAVENLPPVTEGEAEDITGSFDDADTSSDADEILKIMRILHPDLQQSHVLLSAESWLRWQETVARSLVIRYADQIMALAEILARAGTLSGAAVAALIGPT